MPFLNGGMISLLRLCYAICISNYTKPRTETAQNCAKMRDRYRHLIMTGVTMSEMRTA